MWLHEDAEPGNDVVVFTGVTTSLLFILGISGRRRCSVFCWAHAQTVFVDPRTVCLLVNLHLLQQSLRTIPDGLQFTVHADLVLKQLIRSMTARPDAFWRTGLVSLVSFPVCVGAAAAVAFSVGIFSVRTSGVHAVSSR